MREDEEQIQREDRQQDDERVEEIGGLSQEPSPSWQNASLVEAHRPRKGASR